MAQYSSDSDSDAPEEVSLQTAKATSKKRAREQLDHELQIKQARREKNRARDQRLKQSSKKALEPIEQVDNDDSVDSSKADYLDPSLFEQSAALYTAATNKEPPPGQGKKSIQAALKEKKRLKRERLEEQARLQPGASKQVGDKVLQHLPDATINPLAGMPIVHPSSSSSSKFVNDRLYLTKKRALKVLDNGKGPAPSAKKRKGQMSDESKRLLGLLDPKDEAEEAKKEKKRKKGLLLQSEGLRKHRG